MIRSFRLRIALLVMAVTGVALIGFSGAAWRLIYGIKVSRVDTRLEIPLRRLSLGAPSAASSTPSPTFWRSRPATDLLRSLGGSAGEVALQVRDEQGNLIYESENWSPRLSPAYPSSRPRHQGRRHSRQQRFSDRPNRSSPAPIPPRGRDIPIRFRTQRTPSGSWRIGAARSSAGSLAIAVSLRAVNQEMAIIRTIFLVAVPGTLLVVAAGAWGLAGSALTPIRRLTRVMERITVTGLDQRVSAAATDVELAALIDVFNQMLERLERSFKQASRFSADAAHELKTPLAILQGELEQMLQQAESGAEQQQLGSLLDEVRRLSTIVRKLLLLSLADAGQMALHKTQVDLSAMLAVAGEDLELLAPHLRTVVDIDLNLCVLGDRDLLLQVIQNLISNAIKYNLPQGWVRITAHQRAKSVQVSVTNASSGITAGDRVFERFYRGDPSHNRRVEGLGLGLSLSREIVQAHGGTLVLDTTPADQTQFTMTLPRRPQ